MNFNEIKTGRRVVLNGEPFEVIYHEHSKTGRAGAVLRTKIRNLKTGSVQEKIFHSSDKVDEANIEKIPSQFLYSDENHCYFMDMETYDQITVDRSALKDSLNFLTEGLNVTILNFDGSPINIELPVKVELEVVEAPPNIKGDTQSGGDKLVTTETGLQITVPLFIESGDKILVNTQRGEYVSKVK